MEGSKAYYCLLCAGGAILGFNCEWEDCVEKKRTTENMEAALLQYLQKSATSRSIKNIDGVNNKRMLPLDVTKVLVPILHAQISFLQCQILVVVDPSRLYFVKGPGLNHVPDQLGSVFPFVSGCSSDLVCESISMIPGNADKLACQEVRCGVLSRWFVIPNWLPKLETKRRCVGRVTVLFFF
jgi:hypothetical protein